MRWMKGGLGRGDGEGEGIGVGECRGTCGAWEVVWRGTRG